jgi:hypothetical protein
MIVSLVGRTTRGSCTRVEGDTAAFQHRCIPMQSGLLEEQIQDQLQRLQNLHQHHAQALRKGAET